METNKLNTASEGSESGGSEYSSSSLGSATVEYHCQGQAYFLPRHLYDAIFRDGYLACLRLKRTPAQDSEVIVVDSSDAWSVECDSPVSVEIKPPAQETPLHQIKQ